MPVYASVCLCMHLSLTHVGKLHRLRCLDSLFGKMTKMTILEQAQAPTFLSTARYRSTPTQVKPRPCCFSVARVYQLNVRVRTVPVESSPVVCGLWSVVEMHISQHTALAH